jgi:hypothetical protein
MKKFCPLLVFYLINYAVVFSIFSQRPKIYSTFTGILPYIVVSVMHGIMFLSCYTHKKTYRT